MSKPSNSAQAATDATERPSNKEETVQIQKRGILKNAVAMPVLKLSRINVAETEVPAAETTDTPASPTPETVVKEVKPVTIIHETAPADISSPASPPPAVTKPQKSKKIVDIAEVLRRGKLAAAEKAEAAKSAPEKVPASKTAEAEDKVTPLPKPLENADEPASPTKSVGDIMSPTTAKPSMTPKVIPLIPLSPTSESRNKGSPEPLSIPLSPTKLDDKEQPSSPTATDQSSLETQPRTIPLSPTSLKNIGSQEKLNKAPAFAEKLLASVDNAPASPDKTPASPDEPAKGLSEIVTPIVPISEQPALPPGMLSPDVPAFLVCTTDEDDSDNEPMLSIAEDVTTPTKDQSKKGSPDSVAPLVKSQMEELNIKPISSSPKQDESKEKDVSCTFNVTDMMKDFVDRASPIDSSTKTVSTDESVEILRDATVAKNGSRLSPVFGPQASTVARGFESLISPLAAMSSTKTQPETCREKDETPSSPQAELLAKMPSVYIPIIPCDKLTPDPQTERSEEKPDTSSTESTDKAAKATHSPIPTDVKPQSPAKQSGIPFILS